MAGPTVGCVPDETCVMNIHNDIHAGRFDRASFERQESAISASWVEHISLTLQEVDCWRMFGIRAEFINGDELLVYIPPTNFPLKGT